MASATFITGTSALNRLLPCQTGYALGRIVPNRELEWPYLLQEMANLSAKIDDLRSQKLVLMPPTGQQRGRPATSDTAERGQQAQVQDQVAALDWELGHKISNLKALQKKIQAYEGELSKEYSTEGSTLTEMLPIDFDKSMLVTRDLGSESETLDYFLVEHKETAEEEVRRFVKRLVSTYDSPGAVRLITQVSKDIFRMLAGDQKVCILGSFVTLKGVRTIDPLVIRNTSTINPKVLEQTEKFSVITQAVLGGLFVGYGYIGGSAAEQKLMGAQVASKVSAFSYVSHGAIPKAMQTNLWDTYVGWKAQLRDEEGGFPIAFSVRHLSDVLAENGSYYKQRAK